MKKVYGTHQYKTQIAVTCNKCGKEVTINDMFEWQEFFFYEATGGFGSVFGDEAEIEIDLCQTCFKEILGPYNKPSEILN
jgi:hypothetical protein